MNITKNRIVEKQKIIIYWSSYSQPFLSRGTLGELCQYLAAPLDAQMGLKVYKSDNVWRHPWP